jgi:adenylate kinase
VEAIMPRSISRFVKVAVAIGVAVVGASAIGIAAAQSSHEQAKTTAHRIMAKVLKTEFRIGDHQQLRKIFMGDDRLR